MKSTDSARMTMSPGTMNAAPPTRAPSRPRIRQAQKIVSWVDAGPGSRLQTATASSNSRIGASGFPLVSSMPMPDRPAWMAISTVAPTSSGVSP